MLLVISIGFKIFKISMNIFENIFCLRNNFNLCKKEKETEKNI